jgi:hypothetical protein
LPERSRWDNEIFNSKFYAFLREVRQRPEQLHRFDAVSPEAGVHITYDPARRGTLGSNHLVYTVATAIDKNPVYTALKKKGDQLKATGYDGLSGIFLCDGRCQMLSAQPHFSSFSVDEVIRYSLRQFESVWFVIVFGAKQANSQMAVHAKLHLNQKKKGHDFSRLNEVASAICQSIPEPQWSPYNAIYRVKAQDLTGRYYGGLTHGGNVKMSAREMLEVLAGVKTVGEFEKNYRLTPSSNPFRRMLEQGRLIANVTVERIPGRDDDEVTIEFGDPDAAVAPFRVP